MVDVVRMLNSVGKKIFVEYYDDFKNVTDKSELAQKLLQKNPNASSIGGQLTRISCALRIFDDNLQLEALNIIINARVDSDTISKAENIRSTEMSS